MFIREIKSKGKTYLNVIESYRKDGVTKQKYIASFGCVDYLNPNHIRKLALSLLRYCKEEKNIFDISEIEEKDRKIWGPVKAYRRLWETFDLENLFSNIVSKRKIRYNFFNAILLMLIDRLSEPKSKLKCYNKQERYYGIEKEEELQHLYRSLDVLAEEKEKIEMELFERQRNLFNLKIDLVFYDVTTLYFESCKMDDLRNFGFSKNCKINEVQVLLGLLVDLDGCPIGFDVFPGNKFEGHTLETAINKLKNRFQINKIIFVGDRAMLSEKNQEVIQGAEYEYIVGSRIKNKSDKIKAELFRQEDYIHAQNTGEDEFKYKIVTLGKNKLICSWSQKRAKKDKADRERLITKAKKILGGNGEIVSRRGALKYLDISITDDPKLLEEKIKEDEKWDGYYGVETNGKDITAETALEMYHDLWRVEESFRILKSHFETRPIYHRTPKRIKGHLVLCFIAFLLERRLEIELKKHSIEYSAEKIRDALTELQFSRIEINKQIFYVRSKVEGLANDILRILKIAIPAKISVPENF